MGTITCVHTRCCLPVMALFCLWHAQATNIVATPLLATAAHKKACATLIEETITYTQQNKRYTPAIQQIHACLSGGPVTDASLIPTGVQEFASAVAAVKKRPEAACCALFSKQLDQHMAACTRTDDNAHALSLESIVTHTIQSAIDTITRGGSNSLIAGDGAGNNVFVITTQGDLTCSRDGAQAIDIASTGTDAKTVAIGSTDTTSSTAINAGSGKVTITGPTDINVGTSTNAVTIGGTGAQTIGIGSTASITGAKVINIGTGSLDGGSTAISIGTGAAAAAGAVAIVGTTTLDLLGITTTLNAGNTTSGTQTVSIATGDPSSGASKNVNIATGTLSDGGTKNVQIGSATGKVGIGGAVGSNAVTITGVTDINVSNNAITNINTGTTTSAVNIGGTGAQTIGIGSTASITGAKVINLGTGSLDGGSMAISIGTGASAAAGEIALLGTANINATGSSATTLGSATSTTTIGGLLKNASGTYAAPSVTFTADATTGSYYYSDTTRKADSAISVQAATCTLTQGPDVAFLGSGKFAIVYVDSTPHVYLQLGTAAYSIGAQIQVDKTHPPAANSGATVAYDSAHDYIIVSWIDGSDGHVWFRRLTSAGADVDAGDVQADSANVAPTSGFWPSVTVGIDGTIAIFWAHLDVTTYEIYARRTNTSGAVQGSDVLINTGYLAVRAQRAIYLGGSRTIACWKSGTDLYYNVLDLADGSAGTPTKVNTKALHDDDQEGCVSAIPNGNVLFTFKETGDDGYLLGIIKNNDLTSNVLAETALTSAAVGSQSASAGDGTSFMIGWTIATHHLNVQNYTATGIAIGSVVDVLSSGTSCGSTSRPALALCGGNCVASWYNYNAGSPNAVNAQALSLRGLCMSAIGARSARMTKDTNNNCTTDVYGTLNVTGGDIRTTGSIYSSGDQATGDLVVNGNLSVKNGAGTTVFSVARATGNVCTLGSVSSTASDCSVSDRRIKTDIATLNQIKCLEMIKKMRPVSYHFTSKFIKQVNAPKTRQIGLIAQEVGAVAPEIIGHADFGTGYELQTVSYERLVPYLICSIQLLSKKIELLERERATHKK